jgi:hypothetical protein
MLPFPFDPSAFILHPFTLPPSPSSYLTTPRCELSMNRTSVSTSGTS